MIKVVIAKEWQMSMEERLEESLLLSIKSFSAKRAKDGLLSDLLCLTEPATVL